ncbi:uncharacterized protein EV154DRAFT_464959 [Mucor mucedo]|uniref:uncharacterized protein n=1 Tax=Mucor mucedo TaxID=29922 RepID=UPI0022211E03|nr:uncharacterized protein EV154DRAFT_464959 [Mucor mucedo]KAI7890931.1 hypothetical protein EV154DRAFT_464959 [Mucor mucedo]
MTLVNRFPSEFLHKVSTHLSVQDCWHATLVCRSWHHTFQRVLYKKVFIYSDTQLKQLVSSISYHGYLVKEIHLISTISHESTTLHDNPRHVLLDQDTLLTLNHLCPLLEVLRFHPSQWTNLELSDQMQWSQMRQCGIVHYEDFTPSFLTVFGTNLTQLHMTHAAHDLETLVDRLRIPTLKELTLEILVQVENEIIPTQHLERMHANLPQLTAFHFKRNKTPHHEAVPAHDIISLFAHPTTVRTLTLHGHVDSIQWFQFITTNYPKLQELELTQITTSRFGTKWMWQTALIDLIRSLPSLQRLSLGGKNIPQLFSKALLVELNSNKQIDEFNIDFQTYQAIESCQFLLSLASSDGLASLRHLSLRVWEQIPGWSGVTKNLFQCQGLVSLQLWFSKGFMDQFPFTSFLIDHFLLHLPRLKKLALTGAHVQVMYKDYKDLDIQVFDLEELSLVQCKIERHDVVLQYLSTCCPRLDTMEFSKCESERSAVNKSHVLNEWTMDLQQIRLKKLVLSSILIYIGTVQTNDFIGIRIHDEKGQRTQWCSTTKSMIYPEYGLCEDTEKNTELDKVYQSMPGNYTPTLGVLVIHCQSVTQVFLDNLKIPNHLIN